LKGISESMGVGEFHGGYVVLTVRRLGGGNGRVVYGEQGAEAQVV